MVRTLFVFVVVAAAAAEIQFMNEFKIMPGHKKLESYEKPLPKTYTRASDLPDNWSWGNVNGTNYLTKSLNQHIPQYCGSCWAHGAASAFADRIKIARKAKGADINMAIQYILDCASEVAGSCHGGSASGTYEFVKEHSGHWPYDTCLQYEACSAESKEGACARDGADYSCSAMNTCRTCSTFSSMGGSCAAVSTYPNATIAEYGQVSGEADMMAEIYRRGPIACGVDATPLHKYNGGIFDDKSDKGTNHIISVVGWGVDKDSGKKFWIVRNSWGEYWGELGYFRIVRGENQLDIESSCSWATPGQWTEHNFACWEDGSNCQPKTVSYRDPSGE